MFFLVVNYSATQIRWLKIVSIFKNFSVNSMANTQVIHVDDDTIHWCSFRFCSRHTHRSDTPGWGRVCRRSGRHTTGPQWRGDAPSPGSLAPPLCVLCPLHCTLFLPESWECVYTCNKRASSFCYPLRKRSLNEERSSLRPLLQFITFTFTWVIRHCFKCTAYICLYTISTTSLLTDQHHEEAGFQTLLHSQHNGTPQCPHTPHYSFCISTPYTLVFPLILVFLYALIPLYICIPDHLDILYTSVFLKTLVSCLLQYPMHFSIPIHPVHFKFKFYVIYTIPHSTTLVKCLLWCSISSKDSSGGE